MGHSGVWTTASSLHALLVSELYQIWQLVTLLNGHSMRADGAEEPLTIESFTLPASDLGVKEEGDSNLLLSFSSIL